jgi:hypothetical protein
MESYSNAKKTVLSGKVCTTEILGAAYGRYGEPAVRDDQMGHSRRNFMQEGN